MKRIISTVTAVVLLLSLFVFAYAAGEGADMTSSYEANDILLLGGKNGKLDSTDGLEPYFNTIKKITIKGGVTDIAEGYFSKFTALESVTVAASVTSAYAAFKNCPALKTVTFADGTKEIPNHILALTPALKTVNIPDSVTHISFSAFEESGLESITLPDSVTDLGSAAFMNCRSLKNVTLSKSLTLIGQDAFKGTAIESIDIPDSVREIWTEAFADCKNLKSVSMPDGLEHIDKTAFNNTPVLKSGNEQGAVYIDTCLIDGAEFSGALTVKDGTRSIAQGAFDHNHGITSLTLPASVNAIGKNAFVFCENLNNINMKGTPLYIGVTAFVGTGYHLNKANWQNGALYIGSAIIDIEKDLSSYTVKHGTVTIAGAAFKNTKAKITLTPSIRYICDEAFWGNETRQLVIHEGTEVLGEAVFAGSALISLALPSTLIRADRSAFSLCDRLDIVVFGGTKAKWDALWINLPDSATLICEDGTVVSPEQEADDEADDYTGSYDGSYIYDDLPDDYDAYVPGWESPDADIQVGAPIMPEVDEPDTPELDDPDTPEVNEPDTPEAVEPDTPEAVEPDNNGSQDKQNDKDDDKAKKPQNLWWIAVIIAVVAIVGGGAVFFVAYKRHNRLDNEPEIFISDEE